MHNDVRSWLVYLSHVSIFYFYSLSRFFIWSNVCAFVFGWDTLAELGIIVYIGNTTKIIILWSFQSYKFIQFIKKPFRCCVFTSAEYVLVLDIANLAVFLSLIFTIIAALLTCLVPRHTFIWYRLNIEVSKSSVLLHFTSYYFVIIKVPQ